MRRLVLFGLLVSSAALGQVRPMLAGPDPMHQQVGYAAGQTVVLEAAPGFQLTVELEDGEEIKSAAAGDGGSWQVVAPVRSSQFFVRPNVGAQPTNLTVVTDRRSYYFLLVASAQMSSTNALSVRFIYPETVVPPQETAERQAASASGSYRLSGASAIRPTLIWDDGAKTFLDWPEGVEAPAIFAIDGAGQETLVNSYHRDGRFVIDAVYTRLLFRLDRLMARADRKPAGREARS